MIDLVRLKKGFLLHWNIAIKLWIQQKLLNNEFLSTSRIKKYSLWPYTVSIREGKCPGQVQLCKTVTRTLKYILRPAESDSVNKPGVTGEIWHFRTVHFDLSRVNVYFHPWPSFMAQKTVLYRASSLKNRCFHHLFNKYAALLLLLYFIEWLFLALESTVLYSKEK